MSEEREELHYSFGRCCWCNRNIDLWHGWQYQTTVDGAYMCQHCIKSFDDAKADRFPLDEHFKPVMEPYIQWREKQAVAAYATEIAQKYLAFPRETDSRNDIKKNV